MSMIEFASSDYLYGLLGLIPLVILSFWCYYWRRCLLKRFVPSRSLRDVIMPMRIGRKRLIRDVLLISAMASLLIALARPQRPSLNSKDEEQKGIEMMICIDVSNSMLATDIAPSRMSFVRRSVSKLVDNHDADRIGIIVFAANAYIQLPLTDDHTTIKEYLSSINPNMLSAQGTNIASAIELAQSAFGKKSETSKAILLFTDVEDHEHGSIEAVRNASKNGYSVHVIGVGTEEGSGIPSSEGYLRDETGRDVVSKLNVELGKQLASVGNGVFIATQNEDELLKVLDSELNKLPKQALGYVDRTRYTEVYIPWVLGALLLLILEVFVTQRRNKLWMKYNLFKDDK